MYIRKLIIAGCILLFTCIVVAQEPSKSFQLKGKKTSGSILIGKSEEAKEVFLNDVKIKLDSSGFFILGFDRDDTGKQVLKVILKDGTEEKEEFELAKRTYDIQRINNLDQKYVSPPKETLAKIEKESQIIKEARKTIDETALAYFLSGFMRPVEGGRVSGIFGSQRILNGEAKNPHNGIDVALPTGAPVYAMADGIVCLRGDDFHYNGNFILLDHGHGLNSVYVHLNKAVVSTGEKVTKGQKIGEVGSTGRSTGPHLHWGVQWYKKRIDPELLLEIEF